MASLHLHYGGAASPFVEFLFVKVRYLAVCSYNHSWEIKVEIVGEE